MRWDFGREGIEYLHHHAGGTNVVGLVLMIILWAAVITALVVGIRALVLYGRHPRGFSPSDLAALPGRPAGGSPTGAQPAGRAQPAAGESPLLATLQERYARGEIDRDDFLQRKQDLGLD